MELRLPRLRILLLFVVPAFLLILSFISLKTDLHTKVLDHIKRPQDVLPPEAPLPEAPPLEAPPLEAPKEKEKGPFYKPAPTDRPTIATIVDNFPRAVRAKSPKDLPPIPPWNAPPKTHVSEKTPLFIGFTRNWRLLQQVVVSYITAGWPPEDIYVVENTGTQFANRDGKLTIQNPFYLDYHRLTKAFGVNVIVTPALLTFAQLQNLYLHTALENNWPHYFWSHMDVIALAMEGREVTQYKSLYMRAVDAIREQLPHEPKWAIVFFAYDWLALVNVAAYEALGGWDTMIGYYGTDCDMHERIYMSGYTTPIGEVGWIHDVGETFDDLEILYRTKHAAAMKLPEDPLGKGNSTDKPHVVPDVSVIPKNDAPDTRNSTAFHGLLQTCKDWLKRKNDQDQGPRNRWQTIQYGGEGEPYYKDPDGFETALQMHIKTGTQVYDEKWGHRGCNLREAGLKPSDAWKVEHDWDREDQV